MSTAEKTAAIEPQHSHYVSMSNGRVYSAMRAGSAGYEDKHPDEWRPATPAEVRAFHNGVRDTMERNEIPLHEAPSQMATPAAIRLAADDESAPTEGAPAAVAADIPPPLPGALGTIVPQPAFGDTDKAE